MEIKLSIKHNQKVSFISKEIPDVQIVKAKFPIDILQHNFNEITTRMIEKIKEELLKRNEEKQL